MNEDTHTLLTRAAEGNQSSVARLLDRHRSRLRGYVRSRLDPRLARRVDASDVVQDAIITAQNRLEEFLQSHREGRKPQSGKSFFVWMRGLTLDRLLNTRRFHLAQRRSIEREKVSDSSDGRRGDEAGVVGHLMADQTSPSERIVRQEQCLEVRRAMQRLRPNDQTLLHWRYVDQEPPACIADRLGISGAATRKRLFDAIRRLHRELEAQHAASGDKQPSDARSIDAAGKQKSSSDG